MDRGWLMIDGNREWGRGGIVWNEVAEGRRWVETEAGLSWVAPGEEAGG